MLRNLIVVAALFVLAFVQPAKATPVTFTFGISSEIAVPANERVILPAVLINTGAIPIEFGCARTPCGGLDFGAGVTAGPNESTDPLNFDFLDFYQQFAGVTIPVGEMFPFAFGSMQFNSAAATVLHPIFSFRFSDPEGTAFALIDATIMAGPELQLGPLSYDSSTFVPNQPIPEPSTFVMLVSVGAAAGLTRVRRRLMNRRTSIV